MAVIDAFLFGYAMFALLFLFAIVVYVLYWVTRWFKR